MKEKQYTLKKKDVSYYGTVIGIHEYLKNNKWTKLKTPVGTSADKLTDEKLTEFINKIHPEEINLIIKDKRGEIHHVDFPIEVFE